MYCLPACEVQVLMCSLPMKLSKLAAVTLLGSHNHNKTSVDRLSIAKKERYILLHNS